MAVEFKLFVPLIKAQIEKFKAVLLGINRSSQKNGKLIFIKFCVVLKLFFQT